jgi:hypothetical protein
MDSAFLGALLTACSLFRHQLLLPLSASISSKRKQQAKDFFPGLALASKQGFFCCLNLAIALQSVVLWLLVTILTPHVGPLMILRRLVYTT